MAETHNLEDWNPLDAERRLATEMGTGQTVVISDDVPPETLPDKDPRVIRNSFLRALILGSVKGHPPHEKGVRVRGAYLKGDCSEGVESDDFSLQGITVDFDLSFEDCRFSGALVIAGAELKGLRICRCQVQRGIDGRGLSAKNDVKLVGNTIKGGAEFLASTFKTNLLIEHNNSFGVTRIDADDKTGYSLDLDAVYVERALAIRKENTFVGRVTLVGAELGLLLDTEDSWPTRGNLRLDACKYQMFALEAPTDAEIRKKWLLLSDAEGVGYKVGHEFRPQPWEECARVLRAMGHEAEARAILIEKEKRQRSARRDQLRKQGNGLRARGLAFWDTAMGLTTRYGREPLWALAWLAGFWVIGLGFFATADRVEALKPNNASVLQSVEWVECFPKGSRHRGEESQLACFHDQPEAGGYPAFNPLVYSADALLPIFDLGMQEYWVPDENTAFGKWARVYLWVHVTMGWALSLLAVAGLSGLIRTDNTT